MISSYLTPKLREGETVDLAQFSPRERINIRLYGLACKDWTPQDVFEYKCNWRTDAESVNIKGKLDQAQRWCKTNLYHQDFDIERNAMPDDSHIIRFKNAEDAMIFKIAFSG